MGSTTKTTKKRIPRMVSRSSRTLLLA